MLLYRFVVTCTTRRPIDIDPFTCQCLQRMDGHNHRDAAG